MQKIEIVKQKELITQQLMNALFHEKLPPDGKIPSARQLSEQYGISIVTMREILKTMESIGILSVRHGRGIFLNNPDTIIEELFDTRILVESYCAETAAHEATDQEITELASILAELQNAALKKDMDLYSSADYRFHIKISQMCRNRILEKTLQNIRVFLHYQLLETNKKLLPSLQKSIDEHVRIFNAISERNCTAATKAMYEHLAITRRLWKQ